MSSEIPKNTIECLNDQPEFHTGVIVALNWGPIGTWFKAIDRVGPNEWHCKSAVCVCMCSCCGVVRLIHTCTWISQYILWGLVDTPKEKNRKMKGRTRKWSDQPLELNIPKCNQPKHFKILKRRKFLQTIQDPRIQTDGLIETQALGGSQWCWHLTIKVLPKNPNLVPTKYKQNNSAVTREL